MVFGFFVVFPSSLTCGVGTVLLGWRRLFRKELFSKSSNNFELKCGDWNLPRGGQRYHSFWACRRFRNVLQEIREGRQADSYSFPEARHVTPGLC